MNKNYWAIIDMRTGKLAIKNKQIAIYHYKSIAKEACFNGEKVIAIGIEEIQEIINHYLSQTLNRS